MRKLILGLMVLSMGFIATSDASAGPIKNLISKLRNRSGCASGSCR